MTDHNIALFLKFIGNLLGTYYDRDDDDCGNCSIWAQSGQKHMLSLLYLMHASLPKTLCFIFIIQPVC